MKRLLMLVVLLFAFMGHRPIWAQEPTETPTETATPTPTETPTGTAAATETATPTSIPPREQVIATSESGNALVMVYTVTVGEGSIIALLILVVIILGFSLFLQLVRRR